jgi:hypothetical protein
MAHKPGAVDEPATAGDGEMLVAVTGSGAERVERASAAGSARSPTASTATSPAELATAHGVLATVTERANAELGL